MFVIEHPYIYDPLTKKDQNEMVDLNKESIINAQGLTLALASAWLGPRALTRPLAHLHGVEARARGRTLWPLVPITPLAGLYKWIKQNNWSTRSLLNILTSENSEIFSSFFTPRVYPDVVSSIYLEF